MLVAVIHRDEALGLLQSGLKEIPLLTRNTSQDTCSQTYVAAPPTKEGLYTGQSL